MDFNELRSKNKERLDGANSLKEEQQILQQEQIICCTEKADIEKQIQEANLRKAKADADNAEAQVNKTKAETVAAKTDKYVKIGGLFVGVVTAVVGSYTALKGLCTALDYENQAELQFTSKQNKILDSFIVKAIDTAFNPFKK